MKFLKAVTYILLLIIVVVAAVPHVAELRNGNVKNAQLATSSPEIMVRQIIANVFAAINTNKKAKKGDSAELRRIAETLIAPYCDFEKMTTIVVGPAWRSATQGEREDLVNGFRSLLLKLYSGTLRDYADYSFSIMSRPPASAATEATVRVELNRVTGESGAQVSINAYLEKGADGRWRIVDISLNGISVLMSYRGEFQQEIKSGGIQELIDHIRELNTKANKRK